MALPAAGLVAVLGAAVAVVSSTDDKPRDDEAVPTSFAADITASSAAASPAVVSRSAERAPLVARAEVQAQVQGRRFASRDLTIRNAGSESAKVVGEVASGDKVGITGRARAGWTQVVDGATTGWVQSAGLTKTEPLGSQPCPRFSESGLTPDAVKTIRAVCTKWPSIAQIGTTGGAGEHATGQALDIMLGPDIGYDVASFLQANQAKLGVEYVIYRQRIWRPATSNQWRGMSDRGGVTANHMDHVHVTVYGNTAAN